MSPKLDAINYCINKTKETTLPTKLGLIFQVNTYLLVVVQTNMFSIGLFHRAVQAASVAQVRSFHAAAPLLVRQKHLRRLNRLHKHWAKQMFNNEDTWVDPVLGKPNVSFLARISAVVNQPESQVDLLEPESTSKLLYRAEQSLLNGEQSSLNSSHIDGDDHAHLQSSAQALQRDQEAQKREAVLRIVNLQNTNNQQRQKQAVLLARKEFQRFEGDTGSPEVQAAVATVKIHAVAAHAKQTKKDVQSKRRLEHMVQTRRNILLYLKRTDPKRYIWSIEKLGLSDDAVTAEFHMSRHYLWRTQFYGEKTLPIKKTVHDTKKAREYNVKRSKAERYLSQHDPEALYKMAS